MFPKPQSVKFVLILGYLLKWQVLILKLYYNPYYDNNIKLISKPYYFMYVSLIYPMVTCKSLSRV